MTPGERLDADAIMDWLVSRLAAQLNVAPDDVPLHDTFFNLGLNSLNTLIIAGELGEHLGIEDFSPSLFWDHPTIEKLAEFLAAHPDAYTTSATGAAAPA